MDKYLSLMQAIVDYLDGTWLSRADHPALTDRGKIRGVSEQEIAKVEVEIGKKLPQSLRAWHLVAGEVPPYLYDYDADYSLRDLRTAQETAKELTAYEECEWQLTENTIPFSQRIGEQFLYVDSSDADLEDPPVFHYYDGELLGRKVQLAFSVHMRETWLQWLDFPLWSKENSTEIKSWGEKGYSDWLSRKRVVDDLRAQITGFRNNLIHKIYHEDIKSDKITTPYEFQQRWLEEFSSSNLWNTVQAEGLRFPFNWVTPPNS